MPPQRVALLANGPSLPRFWKADDLMLGQAQRDFYDRVMGVNTVAWKYQTDWWATVDRAVYEPVLAGDRGFMPRIGMVTGPGVALPKPLLRVLPPLSDHADGQCAYTFPNALAVALRLAGVDGSVTIYGFDCANTPLDFAGKDGQHDRGRWLAELEWVRRVWCRRRCRVHSDLPAEILLWLQKGETVGDLTPPPLPRE